LIVLGILTIATTCGVSRIGAMYIYFGRPIFTVWSLAALQRPSTVFCTGSEWYRFPSSYFLPSKGRLEFYDAGFKGILPGQFNSTDGVPQFMNDMNMEEPARYVDLSDCDFVIDRFEGFPSPLEEAEKQCRLASSLTVETANSKLSSLACEPLLDSQRSPQLSRSFYIPFWGKRYNMYSLYCIWKTNRSIVNDSNL